MMARARSPLTMDLTKYFSLPSDIRVRFDGWMESESLLDKKVFEVTIGEGVVTVERYESDENGKLLLRDGEPARVVETIAVMSLPPEDAMRWSPEVDAS